MIKICKNCGKKFEVSEARVNKGRGHFCSKECKHDYGRAEATCCVCGKTFKMTKTQFNKNNKKYCSRGCYLKDKTTSVVMYCENCGKEIKVQQRKLTTSKHHYCSRKCSKEITKKKIFCFESFAILYVGSYEYKIDLEDVEKVSKMNWIYISNKTPYARSTKRILLHRYIMNCPNDKIVDHINGDIFDNRKCNLRITNPVVNAFNKLIDVKKTRTGYTGITVDNRWKTMKYIVRITINGKRKNFGQFPSLEQAIEMRDKVLKIKEEEIRQKLLEDNNEYVVRRK